MDNGLKNADDLLRGIFSHMGNVGLLLLQDRFIILMPSSVVLHSSIDCEDYAAPIKGGDVVALGATLLAPHLGRGGALGATRHRFGVQVVPEGGNTPRISATKAFTNVGYTVRDSLGGLDKPRNPLRGHPLVEMVQPGGVFCGDLCLFLIWNTLEYLLQNLPGLRESGLGVGVVRAPQ